MSLNQFDWAEWKHNRGGQPSECWKNPLVDDSKTRTSRACARHRSANIRWSSATYVLLPSTKVVPGSWLITVARRSCRNERGKGAASERSFPSCFSLFNPLWLSSWSSTPHRAHKSARHCVHSSPAFTYHCRAKDCFKNLQVSVLVSAYVDLRWEDDGQDSKAETPRMRIEDKRDWLWPVFRVFESRLAN
jgi:hypothetical protein